MVLLIAPEGIEISMNKASLIFFINLLIAPEGIEIREDYRKKEPTDSLNRTRRN